MHWKFELLAHGIHYQFWDQSCLPKHHHQCCKFEKISGSSNSTGEIVIVIIIDEYVCHEVYTKYYFREK